VDIGAGSMQLDFPGNVGTLLRPRGSSKVEVYSFFALNGAFAFEKKASRTITVTDGTTPKPCRWRC